MQKSTRLLLCLTVLFVAVLTAKAQNVTITLNLGWNWISYTRADTLDLDTALVSLTPTLGDPTLYHVFIRRQTTVSGYDADRIVYKKQ